LASEAHRKFKHAGSSNTLPTQAQQEHYIVGLA